MTIAKVTIRKCQSEVSNPINFFARKYDDYTRAVKNVYQLLDKYEAKRNPNAFHELLIDGFNQLGGNELKVFDLPVFSPLFNIHNAFIHEMLDLLAVTAIDKTRYQDKPYKKNFVVVANPLRLPLSMTPRKRCGQVIYLNYLCRLPKKFSLN